MRLWHQKLLSKLPREQLLGQHRECAALRGNGWGRKHSVVNYVFTHNPSLLVAYHFLVMDEMEKRGYKPDPMWRDPAWRGMKLGKQEKWANLDAIQTILAKNDIIYKEHNTNYLIECILNLRKKGINVGEVD